MLIFPFVEKLWISVLLPDVPSRIYEDPTVTWAVFEKLVLFTTGIIETFPVVVPAV
jgi:hypothetical protein